MSAAIPAVERSLPTDGELARLAASPPRPLLRWLDRAAAYEPGVIPLLAIPILVVIMNRSLHPLMAAWGLQLLSGMSRDLPLSGILDPAARPDAIALYQPPLLDWLARLVARGIPTQTDLWWTPISALTTAGLLLAVYGLARQVGGGRLGLFAAALLVIDVPIVGLAGHPSPAALANMLVVFTLWGGAKHLRTARGLASWPLLGAGLSLGALALLHGGLTLLTFAVLIAYWLLLVVERSGSEPVRKFRPKTVWERLLQPASLLLLALTAFAVAGWWWLFMLGRHGAEVWSQGAWQEPLFPGDLGTVGRADTLLDRMAFGLGFGAMPLAILGLISLGIPRDAKTGGSFGRRLLCVWLVVGTIHWLWLRSTSRLPLPELELGLIFARLPWRLMAAVGLLAVCDRRLPNPAIFAGLAAWAGLALANRLALDGVAQSTDRFVGWFAGVLLVAMIATFVLHARAWPAERRRHLVWNALILVAAVTSCGTAYRAFATRVSDDVEWRRLRSYLIDLGEIDRCILVVPHTTMQRQADSPIQLRFVLRSLWPELVPTLTQSWTTAASLAAQDAREGRRTLLIACSSSGLSAVPGTGVTLRPVVPSCFPPGWEVTGFTVAP